MLGVHQVDVSCSTSMTLPIFGKKILLLKPLSCFSHLISLSHYGNVVDMVLVLLMVWKPSFEGPIP